MYARIQLYWCTITAQQNSCFPTFIYQDSARGQEEKATFGESEEKLNDMVSIHPLTVGLETVRPSRALVRSKRRKKR